VQLDLQVLMALLVPLDLLVQLAQSVLLVQLDLLELQAPQVPLAQRVQLVQLVQLVPRALQVPPLQSHTHTVPPQGRQLLAAAILTL
jgi:hypothetical protein